MIENTPSPRKSFNPWHFIWISVVASELFTALLNTIQHYFLPEMDLRQLLKVGAIDALFVPLIVTPIILYFLRVASGLRKINAQLAYEIAERKRTEARFRTIIENASTGILVAEAETKQIRYANPEICRILGYTEQELRSLLVSDLAAQSVLSESAVGSQDHAQNHVHASERVFKRRDGSSVRMSIHTVHMELDDRQCLVWFLSDVTEKHLLQDERLKSQKIEAIGTLAGGIAHDFNNLLQGVFGYISLAKLTLDNREKSHAALEEAEKALHMSVKLTNQLLTFSKGGKPVKKPVDLQPVIENATKFALSGSRTDYRIVVDDGLWHADVDEGQISQVIQNIVLNADQAMPEGGRVEITARNVSIPGPDLPQGLEQGMYVEIAIRDSGVGIPEQNIAKIFDPYFTTKAQGSGLGLATSYSIIKNHNGMIDVRSERGQGSTFVIYLRTAAALKKEERVKPAVAEPGRFSTLISVEAVPELKEIQCTDSEWRIGAAVTLTQIEEQMADEFPALADMLRVFGSRQIRNRATMGGNLVTASPIGDSAPLLLALDAKVVLVSLAEWARTGQA